MPSKYPDVPTYTLTGDTFSSDPAERGTARAIRHEVECDFRTTSYNGQCGNVAAWRRVAWVDETGRNRYADYGSLRCHRHRAIDERTRANSRYGSREPETYDPFDAAAVAVTLRAERKAQADAEALDAIYAKVKVAAAYLLAHCEDLVPSTVADLTLRVNDEERYAVGVH